MITEINIVPVKPVNGLIGFASMVIDNRFYIGSIAIHKRLNGNSYRAVYPSKKMGGRSLPLYYPINKQTGQLIEKAITAKCRELFEGEDG